MADLNLKKGDTVLLAFTVIDPQSDNEGDVKLHDPRGELYWIGPEEIYSKVYVKPKEPVELGSRVADGCTAANINAVVHSKNYQKFKESKVLDTAEEVLS